MSFTLNMVFDIMECTARSRGYLTERVECKVEGVVGIKIDGEDVFFDLLVANASSNDELLDLIAKKLEPFPLKKRIAA